MPRDVGAVRSSVASPFTHYEAFNVPASSREGAETIGGEVQSARGDMHGREVAVGDGRGRAAGRGVLSSINAGLQSVGRAGFFTPTSGVAHSVEVFGRFLYGKLSAISAPRRYGVREARAEQRFIQANQQMVAGLKTPQGESLGLNEAVVVRLCQHAQMIGKAMTRQEIIDLVVSGENIAKSLQDPGNENCTSPITVTVGEQKLEVASSTYTARAVSWYMMASAAHQDVLRHNLGETSTSDMATNGSFIMKDPNNKMYNFLSAAPTAGNRMSTHFQERLGHDKKHYVLGFFPTFGKPQQRGIEDFQSRMPGQGGTMLFDKLKPGQDGSAELFVKFESAGCPPYFSSESHHALGDKFTRFFAALDRNVHHCVNFAKSTQQGGGNGRTAAIARHEHLKRGALKDIVYEPVKALVKDAVRAGVLDKDASSGIAKSMSKFGLPAVLEMVSRIQTEAQAYGDELLAAKARSLLESIRGEMSRLGLASDQYNIERRGAEVHISIKRPPRAGLSE